MNIGIITSNAISIRPDAKRGTEIFAHSLITNLAKRAAQGNFTVTAFASGDSDLSVPIESVYSQASSFTDTIPANKYIIFELALLSKAFNMQDSFDLFHVNIGDGDIALPFTPFVKKPVLITLHNTAHEDYASKYFSIFNDISNVFYVSVSNTQRKMFPTLNYASTIYHGVDTSLFTFSELGGDEIIWAGRAIPKKGMDTVISIAQVLGRNANLFALIKNEHHAWLQHQIDNLSQSHESPRISIHQNLNRNGLVKYYKNGKLFLFPIEWEEPFGLVLIEAMSCGAPIVAYARGSTPEIVKDGETGFLVNPSNDDIRGNWIVKKTGTDGLREATERIYSMPESQYKTMRKSCRTHVENQFSIERMTDDYISIYKKLALPIAS